MLATLEPGSVDCCVTSPPYWGLRDYSVDAQIGLEVTPELFVAELVSVFREVRRVLADHGTLWLNLGDSYAAGKAGRADGERRDVDGFTGGRKFEDEGVGFTQRSAPPGFKPKDLVGIPWRVAFALQADGWYLRSDIVWAKPNPMPESVTDRPTKSHEYVFLLSKQPRYFFDQEAVREPHSPDGRIKVVHDHAVNGSHENYSNMGTAQERWPNGGRNIRSVWEIATQPYPDAHFATFPEALPERCIKAGCPERVCLSCGKASERIVERERFATRPGNASKFDRDADDTVRSAGQGSSPGNVAFGLATRTMSNVETVGWSDCGHDNWRTGTVLDPFMGSGTTALVARRLGRKSVGVELNPEYAELCARRLQQLSLLAEGAA